MAATLANMGRNPITGEHAMLDMASIKDVLSVMFTCQASRPARVRLPERRLELSQFGGLETDVSRNH